MAEHSVKKSKRLSGRLCEHMTYSAREAIKRLRTNMTIALSELDDKPCRVIGVTSAQVSEGKSTVAVNLAYTLAELGKRVLLIDGDMRRPSIHDKLEMTAAPGLSDILTHVDSLSGMVRVYKSSMNETSFNVITSGEIPDNPSELLDSPRLKKLLELLSPNCDYIIIDLPPVNAVVDAVSIVRNTDGMLVVIRENHCPRFVLHDCMEQLHYAKANVLGFVVNGCTDHKKGYQYGRNKYYYNSHYYYKPYKTHHSDET